ncbi:diaminopimelate epimerase [Christiangramia fulva]|uniref:Diaminopimelate epimerase n=1 Tax=Christiangramia fulva TaxID=2126553 RepID=A0A2R3Z0X0_9FLAO|nr:diaminopimelate epimerase [Christiangramia fulva]AVR43896.1 diaminopimelate epimerase [Christiangramia fulva]
MKLTFFKYQGTGNDFVMIDNRDHKISKNNTKLIRHLCDRRFGIGGDGLICLENAEEKEFDFKMIYFNADGNESSMCGNGGRCLVAFAKFLGIIENSAKFIAVDGPHEAFIKNGIISLKMQNIDAVSKIEDALYLNTGSPHHVIFREGIATMDVKKEGADIRYSDHYKTEGTNVNFVEPVTENEFSVRTYERGVEDETLSCGTGVTAVAIAAFHAGKTSSNSVDLLVQGGKLNVKFEEKNGKYSEVWLSGPAEFVFKGEIVC